jgi:hypothetical protein
MVRSFMVLAALVACGGTSSTVATPAIKADVALAESALNGVEAILGTAFNAKAVAAFAAAHFQVGHPEFISVIFTFAASSATLPPDVSAPVPPGSGCIRTDDAHYPRSFYVPAGTDGCTAADHVELDYTDGSVATVSWSGSGASLRVQVAVTAGPWQGTSLSGTFSPYTIKGTVDFQPADGADFISTPADADVDLTYGATSSDDGSGSSFLKGTITDRMSGAQSSLDFTSSGTIDSGTGTATSLTEGNATVQLPGSTVQWLDVLLSTTYPQQSKDPDAAAVRFATAAGGEVLWNGKRVGSFVVQQNRAVIGWTDGTDADEDMAGFGGFAVPGY